MTPNPERIPVSIHPSSTDASRAVAAEIAHLIRDNSSKNKPTVLGLATGSTPIGVYEELIRLHQKERLSFQSVVTFNLDEYWPMNPADLQSYHTFMREHLFAHIDIKPQNIHIPDGTVPRDNVAAFCVQYERQIADAGGVDYQLLGVGRTGHIGFNEPGSPRTSRTRLIALDKVTRMDAASDFFGEWNVPHQALTMGVGTILQARRISLLAFGEHKAQIVRQAVEEPVSNAVAASFLQEHPGARFVLDPAAAAALTRIKTPWLLGPLDSLNLAWNPTTIRRAVIWLAAQTNKPILKLTAEDYNEHHLQDLLATADGGGGASAAAYDLNIEIFRALQNTITGWPAGKPGRPRFVPGRGVKSDNPQDTFPKRVLVFSPHPDDDVISMGGTLIRLCDQGHEVHVAYQTSGNIAVFDDEAVRHADFVEEFARAFGLFDKAQTARIESHIESFVRSKKAGQPDSPELQRIKTLIRRTEARAAARYSGVPADRIHFLDMPFYETGRVRKKPIGEADIRIILDLLESVQPHQVYAAGDLSDPHGTHRVCLAAIFEALTRTAAANRPWFKDLGTPGAGAGLETWLYRGAWQEWDPDEIDMAVPLSPTEVERKRMAIFKHQSQKDKALFPGPSDQREFWQRAESRNRATAAAYDKLGLPEYQAIEGFVYWRGLESSSPPEHKR